MFNKCLKIYKKTLTNTTPEKWNTSVYIMKLTDDKPIHSKGAWTKAIQKSNWLAICLLTKYQNMQSIKNYNNDIMDIIWIPKNYNNFYSNGTFKGPEVTRQVRLIKNSFEKLWIKGKLMNNNFYKFTAIFFYLMQFFLGNTFEDILGKK